MSRFLLPPLLVLVVLNALPPPAVQAAGARAEPATPSQTMRVDIRGPVAQVTVTRSLNCDRRSGVSGSRPPQKGDLVLDVALPVGSALLDVALAERGNRFRDLRPLASGTAPAVKDKDHDSAATAYLEALRSRGVNAADVPFDDEARVRVRLTCDPKNNNGFQVLRYRFSVLVEMSQGAARLAFSPAAELSPPPTRVEVRVWWPLPVGEITIAGAAHPMIGGQAPLAIETVSTRSGWSIAVAPRAASADGESGASSFRLTALAALAEHTPSGPLLAYAIGAVPGTRQPLPERVLFLIDRSRSVAPGGLEAERDAARIILEALPPTTRFDALFFDRGQQLLFPVTRAATREVMAALDDQMVPARLANGTDLMAAVRATGELLRRNVADFGPRCLLVILTDGAVGVPARAAQLATALGPLPGIQLMTAAVSIRPHDDPPVSLNERRVLRQLAAGSPLGGVERSTHSGDLSDAVPAVLEELRQGGDVYDITLRDGVTAELAEVLESAAGLSAVVPLARSAAAARTTAVTSRGSRRPILLRPIAVDGSWLHPLVQAHPLEQRILVTPGLVALAEPVIRSPRGATPADVGPQGFMERSVVRDALSLAFTPRARACYLNRSARTAAERDLSGRVRLALDLVRGEVAEARLDSSTLRHPGIETCLRDAAYAIEVPRAYRNDEAVTAVLNLVFRPRTPDRGTAVATENASLNREIDLLVEAALKDTEPADGGAGEVGMTQGANGGTARPTAGDTGLR